jgi:hypothetical protein
VGQEQLEKVMTLCAWASECKSTTLHSEMLEQFNQVSDTVGYHRKKQSVLAKESNLTLQWALLYLSIVKILLQNRLLTCVAVNTSSS